jgi:hypothetical protein
MTDKTAEAIGRMRTWIKNYGREAYRNHPQFCTDLETLIDAIKGEQRQELIRRFAVAMVGTEWCYNPGARNFTPNKVWEWAAKLADAEPKIGGVDND